MKLKPFLLIVLCLVCGVLIGYYIGSHPKIDNQIEGITEYSPLRVYNGPFGLEMGLSLDDVKQVCKIKHNKNDGYEIIPPKVNDLFETYIVWVDPDHGLYSMRAISEEIRTNDHGTELKTRFENIVESIENKYGRYKKVDANTGSAFNDPQYFMYTLGNGSRELSAVWANKHHSELPDDIVGIAVEVVAKDTYSDAGYVILEYGFSNSDAVKAKADTVF